MTSALPPAAARRVRHPCPEDGGRVDMRAVGAAAVFGVGGPVDLAAAGVGDDEHATEPVRDRVQRADAVHGDAERVAERGGGDHADPQAGERAGPDAGDDAARSVSAIPASSQAATTAGMSSSACLRASWATRTERWTHPSAVSSTTPAVTAGVAVSRASTCTAERAYPGAEAVRGPVSAAA